jgi:hypothetical protein
MLSKLIFWEFPRGSVAYDIVVVLILLFIFAIPRDVFRDQPKASSIVMLPAEQGFLLEPALLSGVAAADQPRQATALVRDRFKTHAAVTRVEPVFDEGELTGYMAFTER